MSGSRAPTTRSGDGRIRDDGDDVDDDDDNEEDDAADAIRPESIRTFNYVGEKLSRRFEIRLIFDEENWKRTRRRGKGGD